MHPNPAFRHEDEDAVLRFVAQRSFAHVFVSSAEGLAVVHTPVLVTSGNRIQFHVARRNRASGQIAGNRVLVSVAGLDAYQSANWYVSPDQVPTWHYEAAEIEGSARPLSDSELVAFLDALSEVMEKRHSAKRPWTRAKLDPRKFEAMTRAIAGFEVAPEAIRGTLKFNQHKAAEDREAAIAGQLAAGRTDIANAITDVAR